MIREDDFKLLIEEKGKTELSNLKGDLGETNNLAPSESKRDQRMLALWKE